MKTFQITLILCLAIIACAGMGLAAWQTHQNKQLAVANAKLMQDLDQSREAVGELTEENALVTAKLAPLEQSEVELRQRMVTLEAEAKKAAQTRPQPFRVHAFVGQDNVGEAWFIPHNVTLDPELGRYTYEPVIVIDESAKQHFTVHHTNVVERELYATQVYSDSYAYPYHYPLAPTHPTKPSRPGGKPSQPIISPPKAPRSPSLPDARARLFAPPGSIVSSRPQVIGTLGTSPVNQRVFSP